LHEHAVVERRNLEQYYQFSIMQTTSNLLMIRPVDFGFNAETAVNNAFQVEGKNENAQQKALEEFNGFVQKLTEHGIDVTVVEDTPNPHTPDSVFPNNWISFHDDGTICLFPMFALNRRLERKQGVLDIINKRFEVNKTIDLTAFEKQEMFLEGTGSMVLDRENKIAYACLSPRTDQKVLDEFGKRTGYSTLSFFSVDLNGHPIYHTNVMMCVADEYSVICLEAVPDAGQRRKLKEKLEKTGKTIIPISYTQMENFAGNMLQVHNKKGEKFLVMSTRAFQSLTTEQVAVIERYNKIIHSSLDTIETNGGGSARCMMAEVFLRQK
jgi:hypothetical protein